MHSRRLLPIIAYLICFRVPCQFLNRLKDCLVMFAKVNILMIQQRIHYCWLIIIVGWAWTFQTCTLYKKLYIEPIFICHSNINLSTAITVHRKACANHWKAIALLFLLLSTSWVSNFRRQKVCVNGYKRWTRLQNSFLDKAAKCHFDHLFPLTY